MWRSEIFSIAEGLEFVWHRFSAAMPSQLVRRVMFKLAGGCIGKRTVLYGGTEIRTARRIIIGCNSSVGHYCILDGRGGLEIGSNVNISTGAWIWTAEHDVNASGFDAVIAPVVIEDYAWISGRTVIMPGVRIGRGAVVATGAVVTKSVEDYVIVAGVPAKPIGVRSKDLAYQLSSCMPFA